MFSNVNLINVKDTVPHKIVEGLQRLQSNWRDQVLTQEKIIKNTLFLVPDECSGKASQKRQAMHWILKDGREVN